MYCSRWARMSGLSNLGEGDYLPSAGAPGAYASTNNPGCRLGASMTFSHDGRYLYLFGGSLHGVPLGSGGVLPRPAFMSDLWVFSFSKKQWAYLSGPLTWAVQGSPHARSTAVTIGAPSRLQAPGARAYASMTADAEGLLYVGYGLRPMLNPGTTINDGIYADNEDESCLDGTVFAVFAEQLHNSSWVRTSLIAQAAAPLSHSVGSEVAAWAWLKNPTSNATPPSQSFTWATTSDDARLGASFLMLPSTVGSVNAAYTNPTAVLMRTGGLTYPTSYHASGVTSSYPYYEFSQMASDVDQSALVALTSPCATNPCVNGGTCSVCNSATCISTSPTLFVGLSTKSYKCHCSTGFYGEHCETSRSAYAPPTAPAVQSLTCMGNTSTPTNDLAYPCSCMTGTVGRLCSPLTVRALVDTDGTPLPGGKPRFYAASTTTHSLTGTAAITLGMPLGSTVTFIAGGTDRADTTGMSAVISAHLLSARSSVLIAQDRSSAAEVPVLETNATEGKVAYTGQYMGASLVYYPPGNCLFLFGGIVSTGDGKVRFTIIFLIMLCFIFTMLSCIAECFHPQFDSRISPIYSCFLFVFVLL